MSTLLLIILGLVIIDLLVIPKLLSIIQENGVFHYLVSTLHKFTFMILVLSAGIIHLGDIAQSMLMLFIFCATFLFVFNLTFDFNTYVIKTFDSSRYNIDGMTDEGKRVMLLVFSDMEKANKKPIWVRLSEMKKEFMLGFNHDVNVMWMVLTRNTKMKEAYDELHKTLGDDIKFSKTTKRDLFYLVKDRVLVDVAVIIFILAMIFSL